ncbi:MAG: hypothetical protein EOP06_13705, partial [Proteobacteria bacterium]
MTAPRTPCLSGEKCKSRNAKPAKINANDPRSIESIRTGYCQECREQGLHLSSHSKKQKLKPSATLSDIGILDTNSVRSVERDSKEESDEDRTLQPEELAHLEEARQNDFKSKMDSLFASKSPFALLDDAPRPSNSDVKGRPLMDKNGDELSTMLKNASLAELALSTTAADWEDTDKAYADKFTDADNAEFESLRTSVGTGKSVDGGEIDGSERIIDQIMSSVGESDIDSTGSIAIGLGMNAFFLGRKTALSEAIESAKATGLPFNIVTPDADTQNSEAAVTEALLTGNNGDSIVIIDSPELLSASFQRRLYSALVSKSFDGKAMAKGLRVVICQNDPDAVLNLPVSTLMSGLAVCSREDKETNSLKVRHSSTGQLAADSQSARQLKSNRICKALKPEQSEVRRKACYDTISKLYGKIEAEKSVGFYLREVFEDKNALLSADSYLFGRSFGTNISKYGESNASQIEYFKNTISKDIITEALSSGKHKAKLFEAMTHLT